MIYPKNIQRTLQRIYTYTGSNFPDYGIDSCTYLNPPIRQFILKYTTIVLSTPNTHHLYLNHYTIMGDDYFEKNILGYKKEILHWLRDCSWRIEEHEDPRTMTKERLLSEDAEALLYCDYMAYIGFKIGDHTFYGMNEKSFSLLEEVLDNNFHADLKVTLYADGIDTNVFTSYLPMLMHKEDAAKFCRTDDYYLLLSLCADERICS